MAIVKASSKGQVVIPLEIREKIGLRPGDPVAVSLAPGGRVTLERIPDDPIEAACGMLSGGPSLTEAILEGRKEEHGREKKKASRLLRPHRVSRKRKGIRKG